MSGELEGVVETPNVSNVDESNVDSPDRGLRLSSLLSWDARQLQMWAAEVEQQVAAARIEARVASEECDGFKRLFHALGAMSMATADAAKPSGTPEQANDISTTSAASIIQRLHSSTRQIVMSMIGDTITDGFDDVAQGMAIMSQAFATKSATHTMRTDALQSEQDQLRQKVTDLESEMDRRTRKLRAQVKDLTAQMARMSESMGSTLVSSSTQAVAVLQRSVSMQLRGRVTECRRKTAFATWRHWIDCRARHRRATRDAEALLARTFSRRLHGWYSKWRRVAEDSRTSQRLRVLQIQVNASRLASLRATTSVLSTVNLQTARRGAFSVWRQLAVQRAHRRERVATALRQLSPDSTLRRFYFHKWLSHRLLRVQSSKAQAANHAKRQRAVEALRGISNAGGQGSSVISRLYFHTWQRFGMLRRNARTVERRLSRLLRTSEQGLCRFTFTSWTSRARSTLHVKLVRSVSEQQERRNETLNRLQRHRQGAQLALLLGGHKVELARRRTFTEWRAWSSGRRALQRVAGKCAWLQTRTALKCLATNWAHWRSAVRTRVQRRQQRHLAFAVATRDSKWYRDESARSFFARWQQLTRDATRARSHHRSSQLQRAFNYWRALSASVTDINRQRAVRIKQHALACALEPASVRKQRATIFNRWLAFASYDTRMVRKCDAFKQSGSRRVKASVFHRWLRAAERQRGSCIEGASFIATQQQSVLLDDMTGSVALLEKESAVNAESIRSVAAQLTMLVNQSTARDDRTRARAATLATLAQKLLTGGGASAGSTKTVVAVEPGDADLVHLMQAARGLDPLMAEAVRQSEFKPTIPHGPDLHTGANPYCECCFDKGAGAQHGAGHRMHNCLHSAALCRKRFVSLARCLAAINSWALTVEQRIDAPAG
jgi:hypothetical protein